eukprot:GHVL01010897.1.p1 GENE.GHVL01010897.1~~GHVL01010897.1.p1  ORF type:complete len:796 (+),score=175.66 GHVL01010897.1:55-2442(+)
MTRHFIITFFLILLNINSLIFQFSALAFKHSSLAHLKRSRVELRRFQDPTSDSIDAKLPILDVELKDEKHPKSKNPVATSSVIDDASNPNSPIPTPSDELHNGEELNQIAKKDSDSIQPQNSETTRDVESEQMEPMTVNKRESSVSQILGSETTPSSNGDFADKEAELNDFSTKTPVTEPEKLQILNNWIGEDCPGLKLCDICQEFKDCGDDLKIKNKIANDSKGDSDTDKEKDEEANVDEKKNKQKKDAKQHVPQEKNGTESEVEEGNQQKLQHKNKDEKITDDKENSKIEDKKNNQKNEEIEGQEKDSQKKEEKNSKEEDLQKKDKNMDEEGDQQKLEAKKDTEMDRQKKDVGDDKRKEEENNTQKNKQKKESDLDSLKTKDSEQKGDDKVNEINNTESATTQDETGDEKITVTNNEEDTSENIHVKAESFLSTNQFKTLEPVAATPGSTSEASASAGVSSTSVDDSSKPVDASQTSVDVSPTSDAPSKPVDASPTSVDVSSTSVDASSTPVVTPSTSVDASSTPDDPSLVPSDATLKSLDNSSTPVDVSAESVDESSKVVSPLVDSVKLVDSSTGIPVPSNSTTIAASVNPPTNYADSEKCSRVPQQCKQCKSCWKLKESDDLPTPTPAPGMNPLDADFPDDVRPETLLGDGMDAFPKGRCKRVETSCSHNWDCCGAATCEITNPYTHEGKCTCGPAGAQNGCTGAIQGLNGAIGIPPPKHGDYGVCFTTGQIGCGSAFDCCGGFEEGGNGDRYTATCSGTTMCETTKGFDKSILAHKPNEGVEYNKKGHQF